MTQTVENSGMERSKPLAAIGTPRGRQRILRWSGLLVIIAVIGVCANNIILHGADWERLGGPGDVAQTIGRFLAIDPALLPHLFVPMLETFMMACLGTLVGLVTAIPVAVLGARNIGPLPFLLYPVARGLMTISRSVHEIVWALLFVAAVGLGSLPGIMAIGMRSIGFVSKMTAEAIENVDPRPMEAIRATGANGFQVLVYGVVPQVLPVFLGTAIFEWDINIRRSTILGLVGAGGLGLTFHRQMQMYNYPGVTTVILSILLLVALGEIASYYARKAVI